MQKSTHQKTASPFSLDQGMWRHSNLAAYLTCQQSLTVLLTLHFPIQCAISVAFVTILCKEIFASYPVRSVVGNPQVSQHRWHWLSTSQPKQDSCVHISDLHAVGSCTSVHGWLLLPPLLVQSLWRVAQIRWQKFLFCECFLTCHSGILMHSRLLVCRIGGHAPPSPPSTASGTS